MKKKYSRVLLKLSGEALAGEEKFGINPQVIRAISQQLAEIVDMGVQLAVVVGGGNIFRGLSSAAAGMDRASADNIGMLATIMNALGLQDALEKVGVATRVMTAFTINEVAEPYIRRRGLRHLEKGRVVICAAGTGNPYFTTDTAAVLRGMELKAEMIIKATRVSGVYDKDPEKFSDAIMFSKLTFLEVLQRQLKVMDAAAISLCMDNNMPVRVLNLFEKNSIKRALMGEDVGTHVQGE